MILNYKTSTVEIKIEEGILKNLNNFLDKSAKYFLLSDENVYSLYKEHFKSFNYKYIITPGEDSKIIDNALLIIEELLKNNFSRFDYIIAFGGGVVGDLAGFVASIYKRGINYISIPTSLIAQVDSAFGGKVGVDFKGYKNQIGSIYHPKLILVDPELIKTLPEIELISGMGEIIKYAALFDIKMFESLENKNYKYMDLIKRSIEIKTKITLEDEYDRGIRNLLNFGHTIGHAIEAKYKYLHGIAIGYGMYLESKNERLKKLLESFGFDFNKNFSNLQSYILKDKKIKNNKIKVIKLDEIGNGYLEEVDINEYLQRKS